MANVRKTCTSKGGYLNTSTKKVSNDTLLMSNFLSLCDGAHSLLDIAEKINIPAWNLYELAEKLISYDLISEFS